MFALFLVSIRGNLLFSLILYSFHSASGPAIFVVVFIWYLHIYIFCSNLKFRFQNIQHLKGKKKYKTQQNPASLPNKILEFLNEINISVRYGHIVQHSICHISTNILSSWSVCDCSLVKEWQYIKHCMRHITCMYSVPQTHRDILLSSWLIRTPVSKFISENWTHHLLKSIIIVTLSGCNADNNDRLQQPQWCELYSTLMQLYEHLLLLLSYFPAFQNVNSIFLLCSVLSKAINFKHLFHMFCRMK